MRGTAYGVAAVMALLAAGCGSDSGKTAEPDLVTVANTAGSGPAVTEAQTPDTVAVTAATEPATTEPQSLETVPNSGGPNELVPNPSLTQTVYALFPQTQVPAWPLYTIPSVLNAFKKYLPNVKLVDVNGNADPALQQTQIDAAIAAGADAVLFSPVVPSAAGGALQQFADAKIPVVALRQDPNGGPVNSYVWVDFHGVGEYWGKFLTTQLPVDFPGKKPVRVAMILGDPTFEVYNRWTQGITPYLDPLIASGQIEVVCKQDTPKFNPTTAQASMDQCLTTIGGDLDAVIVMQDSTANGIAASLKSNDLLGKVKMYGGHDGDVQTLQRILLGLQYGTFHPDGKKTGEAAVALIEAALLGKTPESTGYINGRYMNGFYPEGVPTYLAPETLVTAENMQQTIVDDGFLTKDAICTGEVVDTDFCKSG